MPPLSAARSGTFAVKTGASRPITGRMTSTTPSSPTVGETPPPEALAELDAAARVLQELERSGAELALATDAGGLRVELREGGAVRTLSPRALLDLLAPQRP